MKSYVINLAKNRDRLKKVDRILKLLDVPYERIEAVYGAAMPEAERRLQCNYFRWWCESGCLPRPGEIGAALSHRAIYQKMVDEKIPFCAIFEDDISPDERLSQQLQSVEKWANPSLPQVVLLSNYAKERYEDWKIAPTVGDSSAEAYIVTNAAAAALLRDNTPLYHPSDVWRKMVAKGVVHLYHAFPTVIHPAWRTDPTYVSEVTPDITQTISVERLSPIGRVGWKFKRLLGLMLARVLW